MTYKPGFAVSPMDVLNIIGAEARQLANYIDNPPVIQGEDGVYRTNLSDHDILRRTSRLFNMAQDINAFAEAERARVSAPPPPPVETTHQADAPMN